ncbi:hypothetical protein LWM68_15765 [Niabella sp. W65]|nr:hypothetical protein [Niabella sp. W65]MCH7364083.1 hypothetical protein [Niabella sp. W65]ULT39962.1 hypothetical protein KRR40_34585 [Niabella sp. I65]
MDIIGVTSDRTEIVEKFLNNYKNNFGINMISITEDQEIKKLFPHYQIPHYVWINKSGVVAAITTADYVNAENVRKLILNETLSLPTKNDYRDVASYKALKTLVEIDESRNFPSLKAYSYIGGYQKDVKSFQRHLYITKQRIPQG